MQPLRKQAEDLRARVASACQALHIDARAEELAVLDEQLADSNVWANVERAQMLTRQAASLRSQIEPWQILRSQISDIVELMDLGDDSMLAEFTEQLAALEAEYQERRKDLLFSGEYDNRAAILKLSAGAGGTDAQDWAETMARYVFLARCCENCFLSNSKASEVRAPMITPLVSRSSRWTMPGRLVFSPTVV